MTVMNQMTVIKKFAPIFFCLPLMGGSIEGRVTNSVTGEAVGGVKARFLDRKSYVYESVTDSTGSYRLTGLGDNDYSGEFSKDGCSDTRMNERVHVSGDVPARADAQIQPWGSLRGRVVDEDGKPAPGVRVEGPGRDGAVTGEDGEFEFHELRPGSYTLVAKPEPKIRMEDGVRLGTVAIYYPSATEPAEAVRIPVRAGENVSGLEIRLKSVPVHRVAGIVLDEAGKPVAHATVKLMGPPGNARQPIIFSPGSSYTMGLVPEPEVARIESHEDGMFEFAAVEPGDWRLSAVMGVDDDMPLAGVGSALVSEKDVEDIQIRLAAPFPVEVTMDWGSAQAPARGGYGWRPVVLMPMEGQPSLNVDPAKNAGRINGIFPGRYRVTPMSTGPEVYASAAMREGRDVAGQAVEFAPGAAPLQVIYKSGLGKVRGTVEHGEGSMVMLVPHDGGETSTIGIVKCGAGGSFEINGVIPGDYHIVAFDHPDEGGVQWDDLLTRIVPIASNVRVESGSTASVDLRISKWPW